MKKLNPDLDEELRAIFLKIIDKSRAWIKKYAMINLEKQFSQNGETPFTQYIPIPEYNSQINENVIQEPSIHSQITPANIVYNPHKK